METETEVFAEAVKGWTLTATRIPKRNGSDWKGDARALHFHVLLTAPNGETYATEYSAGSAIPLSDTLRKWPEGGERPEWLRRISFPPIRRKDVERLSQHGRRRDSIHDREIRERIEKVWKPDVVDVLGCLFLDASCVDSTDSFRDYCREFGYSAGQNPADLLDTYNACIKTRDLLRRACGTLREYRRLRDLASQL